MRTRDSDIRAALRRTLQESHASDPYTCIIEEMGIWSGAVRIDLVLINSELIGFELKSERDTLERLPFQADLYSRVFDRLVLVIGPRHIPHATDSIPHWWGITVAATQENNVQLTPIRSPQLNPEPDPNLWAQLLWKEEALNALENFGLAKGWRNKRVKEIHTRLATEVPFLELSNYVRTVLRWRNNWLRKD